MKSFLGKNGPPGKWEKFIKKRKERSIWNKSNSNKPVKEKIINKLNEHYKGVLSYQEDPSILFFLS